MLGSLQIPVLQGNVRKPSETGVILAGCHHGRSLPLYRLIFDDTGNPQRVAERI